MNKSQTRPALINVLLGIAWLRMQFDEARIGQMQ